MSEIQKRCGECKWWREGRHELTRPCDYPLPVWLAEGQGLARLTERNAGRNCPVYEPKEKRGLDPKGKK